MFDTASKPVRVELYEQGDGGRAQGSLKVVAWETESVLSVFYLENGQELAVVWEDPPAEPPPPATGKLVLQEVGA